MIVLQVGGPVNWSISVSPPALRRCPPAEESPYGQELTVPGLTIACGEGTLCEDRVGSEYLCTSLRASCIMQGEPRMKALIRAGTHYSGSPSEDRNVVAVSCQPDGRALGHTSRSAVGTEAAAPDS